jgi:rubrerythrin
VKVELEIPTFTIGSTLENLKFAANGEHQEAKTVHPKFAADTEQEGFAEIAATFERLQKLRRVMNKDIHYWLIRWKLGQSLNANVTLWGSVEIADIF